MAKKTKPPRVKARLPKGFRDIGAAELAATRRMLEVIRGVYEAYGFTALQTPFVEYTDALGKFLPDEDRPNQGVFSFTDDDEQWLSLRYDLTAPLARYVAQNRDKLPTPFRSYREGFVFRNEKPGPGRFRQFMQFDADTVGSASVLADAEVCMMAADTLEKLGISHGDYVVKVNNRKVLDGVLEGIGQADAGARLTVLRAIDKLDRLGPAAVRQLLGEGRKDESGDFTRGAGLDDRQIAHVMAFVEAGLEASGNTDVLARLQTLVASSERGREGVAELADMADFLAAAGYDETRIAIDPAVVRGLDYYTGPVFEAELLFKTTDADGHTVRFGSVGGGGRYDDLVARFTGQPVPATGFSVGVSRLLAALSHLGKLDGAAAAEKAVVVLVLDRDHVADYWGMVTELRAAGMVAEMYVGTAGMKAQMKYADKRGAALAVIVGEDERAKGEVQIKDLVEGRRKAAAIASREEWVEQRPAQVAVRRDQLVAKVREMLAAM
ncbi:MAG TPA: histidine--tRNA ligase, partial [Thermopetrobacter sp.]|nr:histidine--tRNA ligase [Thermopetrobacter sp.]